MRPQDTALQETPAGTAIDPACGMTVDLSASKPTHDHDDETPRLYAQGCRNKFAAGSEQYLSGAHRKQAEEAPAWTMLTCPADPEIVQEGFGDCPACGTAPEPMGMPAADAGPNPELVDFTRRSTVGAVLTAALIACGRGCSLRRSGHWIRLCERLVWVGCCR